MCLLVVAWRVHARFPLVVAANRDEFHARPAAPLAPWPQPAGMVAGQDLQAGGAWLAAHRDGRFGVITNFRDMQRPRRNAPSRGSLLPEWLRREESAAESLRRIETDSPGYAGFNLLLADRGELWYASNRADEFARPLPPGLYGLSNHLLDTPWPKLERTRARVAQWLRSPSPVPQELFDALADREPAPDDTAAAALPPTWRAPLSAPFVLHPEYGTRCSTVVTIDSADAMQVRERRFDALGRISGETGLERAGPHGTSVPWRESH